MPDISKINALAIGSVAKVDGLAKASILDIDGVAVPAGFTTGILDTYGSAAAAYSVRRLYSLYTGDCMRIRRSSDNLEQDIPFDSNGELSTTAIATFCGASDGFVKTWYDQSQSGGTGVGNDAVQFTAAEQPKIYDGTTGIIENGTTTVRPSLQWFATASVGNQLHSTGLGTGNTRYFSYVAQATDVAGGGIGAGGYRWNLTQPEPTIDIGGSDRVSNFAWQAGGGLFYEISKRATVDLGYRFFSISESTIEYNFFGTQTAPTNFAASELLLTVRIYEPFRRWR